MEGGCIMPWAPGGRTRQLGRSQGYTQVFIPNNKSRRGGGISTRTDLHTMDKEAQAIIAQGDKEFIAMVDSFCFWHFWLPLGLFYIFLFWILWMAGDM